MPPTKRKATVRRQVLDLKGEGSPSRPSWQTKYQYIQTTEQNGESKLVTSDSMSSGKTILSNNPLSALVGNYNSDSDSDEGAKKTTTLDAKVEDFMKEIQSITCEMNSTETNPDTISSKQHYEESRYSSSVTSWQQCYDPNSGYPYYWNVETNEVTWEMPSELKAAIASAVKQQHVEHYRQLMQQQQQPQLQPQPQPQQKQKEHRETNTSKTRSEVKNKVSCRYPWQLGSDSEDEKIEMITSFGPQSGEEESEEEAALSSCKNKSSSLKAKKINKDSCIGPQLPIGPVSAQDSKRRSYSDDTEAEFLNDCLYETSSLLTHRVQDNGPPGDDSFSANHGDNVNSESVHKDNIISTCSEVPNICANEKLGENKSLVKDNKPKNENDELSVDNCDKFTNTIDTNRENAEKSKLDNVAPTKCVEQVSKEACLHFAENVIAAIEKETPPDSVPDVKPKTVSAKLKQTDPVPNSSQDATVKPSDVSKTTGISGIALLANYEDDSESEESSINEKKKSRDKNPVKPIFPIAITEEKAVKPLFPCIDIESEKQGTEQTGKQLLSMEKKLIDPEPSNMYESDMSLADSTMHKAFKRKKRIEFATKYGPSTSSDAKFSSPEHSTLAPSSQYNLDPNLNEHRGVGFSSSNQSDAHKKSFKVQSGWIQFVKTETINFDQESEPKQKAECDFEGKQESTEENAMANEEIEDSASLLREKVNFLTEGKDEISPVQHMAIQLETLYVAWQQGALSKVYFSRWVKEKCSDLIRHEKSAAPSGWTCLWDRKCKRYFYRNAVTKAIQWDYPTEDPTAAAASTASKPTKDGETEGAGDEMELCFTPPHQSSSEEEKIPIEQNTTLQQHTTTDTTGVTSSGTSSPYRQTLSEVEVSVKSFKKGKKKDPALISNEVDSKEKSTTAAAVYLGDENHDKAPPLPPMPPPPPPPPDEPPPPLPSSPPPLPLDPDQPLPPGVDEPEYNMFRRLSPKQTFKKLQPDASTYTSDVMMTYGYAVPVQSLTSSGAQSVPSIPMQPVEYGYVHDPVPKSPYLIQTPSSSHIIHCPTKKSKLSLSSELDSFYSDIAMLDSSTSEAATEKASMEIPAVQEPPPTLASHTLPSRSTNSTSSKLTTVTTKPADSVPSNSPAVKKKKKTKLTPGLSMKKRGVSSLVAKWQQVQEEVRRDLNSGDDDDDDNDNSTHK